MAKKCASPDCSFVLHGMQIDLRSDAALNCMTREEGLQLAKDLGNIPYFESSSKTGVGMKEMVGSSCFEYLMMKKYGPVNGKQKQKCDIQ